MREEQQVLYISISDGGRRDAQLRDGQSERRNWSSIRRLLRRTFQHFAPLSVGIGEIMRLCRSLRTASVIT